jgi:hypothetical protein
MDCRFLRAMRTISSHVRLLILTQGHKSFARNLREGRMAKGPRLVTHSAGGFWQPAWLRPALGWMHTLYTLGILPCSRRVARQQDHELSNQAASLSR